jgi:hypothetical protein
MITKKDVAVLIPAIAAAIVLAAGIILAAVWLYGYAKDAYMQAQMARQSDELHERIGLKTSRLEPGVKVVAQSHFSSDNGDIEIYEIRAATKPDQVLYIAGFHIAGSDDPGPGSGYTWFRVKHHARGTVVEDPDADPGVSSMDRPVKVEFDYQDLTRQPTDHQDHKPKSLAVWIQRCDLVPVR